ncbi:PREDICTED: BI1-like protein-like [Fragaria vesca subsp. vesca]
MASDPKPETNLDLEAGAPRRLYPSMTENPALRWVFIRKVYTTLIVQLLLTAAVAATVALVRPVTLFFVDTYAGLGVLIADFVLALAVVVALRFCGKKYPVNFILMGLFTVLIGVIVGMHCVFTQVLWNLYAVFRFFLTLYTFWAARRGYDFSFLGPFLFAALTVLIGFSLIQIFHPLGKTSHMIITLVGCIIFCGYIVYDTDKLIKRHEYDEYMLAAVQLYLDAINLFMNLSATLKS